MVSPTGVPGAVVTSVTVKIRTPVRPGTAAQFAKGSVTSTDIGKLLLTWMVVPEAGIDDAKVVFDGRGSPTENDSVVCLSDRTSAVVSSIEGQRRVVVEHLVHTHGISGHRGGGRDDVRRAHGPTGCAGQIPVLDADPEVVVRRRRTQNLANDAERPRELILGVASEKLVTRRQRVLSEGAHKPVFTSGDPPVAASIRDFERLNGERRAGCAKAKAGPRKPRRCVLWVEGHGLSRRGVHRHSPTVCAARSSPLTATPRGSAPRSRTRTVAGPVPSRNLARLWPPLSTAQTSATCAPVGTTGSTATSNQSLLPFPASNADERRRLRARLRADELHILPVSNDQPHQVEWRRGVDSGYQGAPAGGYRTLCRCCRSPGRVVKVEPRCLKWHGRDRVIVSIRYNAHRAPTSHDLQFRLVGISGVEVDPDAIRRFRARTLNAAAKLPWG